MSELKTPYQRHLADPRWQQKRLTIFNRDEFKCRICKDTSSELHIHHCWYEKGFKAWEYPDECYVTLCAACHESETNFSKILLPKIVSTLKRKGYLFVDLIDVLSFFESTEPKQFGTMRWILGVSETIKTHGYDTKGWMKEKLKEIAQDDKP